ncbi:hypothetical protein GOODEAATRI_007397, partial [Goodea atripinnis]
MIYSLIPIGAVINQIRGRYRTGRLKIYSNPGINVTWKPTGCMGKCSPDMWRSPVGHRGGFCCIFITMPDEARALQDGFRPGQEAAQVALVPNIVVNPSDGKGKANTLELDDFTHKRDCFKQQNVTSDLTGRSQPGLGVSQVSVEVGEVKTAHGPEPLKAISLLRGREVSSQSTEQDLPVESSSNKLQNDINLPLQAISCTDSDYSSTKSSPGYACSSSSTDLYDGELLELNKKTLEKMSSISPVNLFETSLDSDKENKTDLDLTRGDSMWDVASKSNVGDSPNGSSSGISDVSSKVSQTRESIDVRSDQDDDGQSVQSRRSVKEGV